MGNYALWDANNIPIGNAVCPHGGLLQGVFDGVDYSELLDVRGVGIAIFDGELTVLS